MEFTLVGARGWDGARHTAQVGHGVGVQAKQLAACRWSAVSLGIHVAPAPNLVTCTLTGFVASKWFKFFWKITETL